MTPPMSDEERLARMRQVWVAQAPSSFEIAAARRRYSSRSRALPPYKLMLDMGWGVALAVACLFALEYLTDSADSGAEVARFAGSQRGSAGEPLSEVAAQDAPPNERLTQGVDGEVAAAAPRIEQDGLTTLAVPGVSYEVLAGKQAVVVLGKERALVRGPQLIEFTFEADRASGFRMHLSQLPGVTAGASDARRSAGDKHPAPSRAVAGSSTAEAVAERSTAEEAGGLSAWSRAAEAMRSGDTAGAEQALTELSQDEASQSADSAALALAQLWVANGEVERARPVLERLAAGAGSEVVRNRARQLLATHRK